jgi:hypothetical protein
MDDTVEKRKRTMSVEALEALSKAREKALETKKVRAEERKKMIAEQIKEVVPPKPIVIDNKTNELIDLSKNIVQDALQNNTITQKELIKQAILELKGNDEEKMKKKKDLIKETILEMKGNDEEKMMKKKEFFKNVLNEELSSLKSEVNELRAFKEEVNKVKNKTPQEIAQDIFDKNYQERLNKYKMNMIRKNLF